MKVKNLLSKQYSDQETSQWLSVSDLMAGLMMVFLFISVMLMRSALAERDKIKQVAVAYQENQESIYEALQNEFQKDLKNWNASIDPDTLTFNFNSSEVLFKSGDASLSNKYKGLLQGFFPRYMRVLEPYHGSIKEIRIEGHTSSIWEGTTDQGAYFNNMELSQNRTRSVLAYVYDINQTSRFKPWIKANIAAVGLSSSKLVYKESGKEDYKRSRRVSFRVITNSDSQIKRILESSQ